MTSQREGLEAELHGRADSDRSYRFVGMFGIDGRLWLVGPDACMEGLQQGALQQRQSPFHLTATLSQSLLTLGGVSEAQ